jgi:hypothetical protein
MKRPVFLLIFIFSLSAHAAEVTLQACASAEVTSESSPGAIQLNSGVSGTNEACIDMNLKSPVAVDEFSEVFFNRSEEQTRIFMWGGCNVSQIEVAYTIEFRWNYSIQISTEGDETATANISYDLAEQDYTEGSGSFVQAFNQSLPAQVCVDGFPFELTVSAQVSRENSGWRLRNDQGVNGLFYDPEKPGHGFDVNVNKEGITIFYYGHTSDGKRLWLISEPLTQDIEYYDSLVLDMFELTGGTFGDPVPVETKWGVLTFELFDCDSGYAVLEGVDGKVQMNLARLAGLSGGSCD